MKKEEQHKRAEELKKEDEKIKKEIESLDKSDEEISIPLEQYKPSAQEKISGDETNLMITEQKDKFGDLEIVELPKLQEKQIEQQANKISIQKNEKIKKESPTKKQKSKGISITPEMEKHVDEKVEKMLQGEKESTEL